jgi:hypothetical protein
LLERYQTGELGAADRAGVEARLAEPAVRAQLEALRADDARLLEALPPAQVAAEVERRLRLVRARAVAEQGGRGSRTLWLAVPVAAAAALLVMAIRPVVPLARIDEGLEVTRAKGLAPHLVVYLKAPSGARQLHEGESVRPRDVVQLATVAPGRPFAAVVSVDGGGGVTRHLPEVGGPPILPSSETALQRSFELDEAPGFERFFLVTAEQPFDVAAVLEAARALARDPAAAQGRPLLLPPSLSQSSFLLRKVSP